MHLPRSSRSLTIVAAMLMVFVQLSSLARAQQMTNAKGPVPTDREISRAIDAVKADPNLAATRTIKTLKWKEPQATESTVKPGWLQWLSGFFAWVNQSTRVLVWAWILVLFALLAGFFVRSLSKASSAADAVVARRTPTHVRELDIRPETLPKDIGVAARALWDGGDHRAALALLYRAMLSRLAHVHHMPIRDSSTEGDCLTFASQRLPLQRHEYVDRLIAVWQKAVYGHEHVQTAAVYALCDGFDDALDSMAPEVTA